MVYRRATRLVAYWRADNFVLHPYRKGPAFIADPTLIRLLHSCSDWCTAREAATAIGAGADRNFPRLLENLVRAGILERRSRPSRASPAVWDQWGHAAAFLHFDTRDHTFERHSETRERLLSRATYTRPTAPTKQYPRRPRLSLPTVSIRTPFGELLKRRRTWRQFGNGRPTRRDLAAILGLTFRLHRWVDLGTFGRVMLRSAPSGGARHPTEAYVLVRDVTGVSAGAYYYSPTEHALIRLKARRFSGADFTRLLAGQHWYAHASVLVCLTSVFERTAWVYRSPRVYKSLLLEAGHFSQTLLLAATARRLAPFCTGAFGATRIERILGLDADRESVMFVTGFGTRPRRVEWAPFPTGEPKPSE